MIQAAEIYGATGFRFLDDPRTGIRLGVPTALLPLTSPTERGSRWANYDGSIEPSRSFALSRCGLARTLWLWDTRSATSWPICSP